MRQIIAFSGEIQVEDIELCEGVQRGLKSKTCDRGRLSARRENSRHHFQSSAHEFLCQGQALPAD